jgi:hypothetical protein
MFSHIMVGANDVQKSKIFYDAILGALGHEPGVIDDKGRCFYRTKTGIFSISKPIDSRTVALPAKILLESVTALQNSTSPICAIRPATRYARCIASSDPALDMVISGS